jgi:carbon-monoxide dehydrogenase small subunit
MIVISLIVNGRACQVLAEPREHLADVLRGRLLLTGTHTGCEHGVCGACTVELDGAPARACITHAGACDGATVRTVEGFGDDPVMAALREAFAAEHALQCGYCTPGMLIAARDVVLRLPDADESRVREEMSGNLCRCTGYRGIVRAILRVLSARRAGPSASGAAVNT